MWFYQQDGMRCGPADADKLEELLRSGAIDETTLVRRDGEAEWRHLDETDLIWLIQDIEETDDFEEDDEKYEAHPEPLTPLEGLTAEGERVWYYLQDDRIYGPVTTEEIAALHEQGELDGTTLVSEGGTEYWQPLEITDIADMKPDTERDGEI